MNNNRKFSVSVCMASYNGEKYIEEQIRSVMKQLGSNDELVISDDGSSDATVSIIRRLQEEYTNIKLVFGNHTTYSINFENAVNHSKNEIILFSDQDDIWNENKIDSVVSVFEKDKDCTTVLHDMQTFSSSGKHIKGINIHYHKGVVRNFIKSCYWGCCMGLKREFLLQFLPIREHAIAHDQLFGLCTEGYGKCVFLDEKLIQHRIHDKNTSHKKTVDEMIVFRWKLLLDYFYSVRKRNMCVRGVIGSPSFCKVYQVICASEGGAAA